jgi:enoyl-CoA hydratase
MADVLATAQEGDVAVVTINRPARGNALNEELFTALRKAALQLSDRTPRVVVVEGAGADFCTGLDPEADNPVFAQLDPLIARNDAFALQERLSNLRTALEGLGRLPCVVIAAIEGRCWGAGLELALATDLRVAAHDASFGFPGVSLGFPSFGGGSVRLTRLVGRGRAGDLVLTGRTIDGREAQQWGLVGQAVAPGTAGEVARELARRLAEGAPLALQQATLSLRSAEDLPERAFGVESQNAARVMSKELSPALTTWRARRSWKVAE